MSTLRSVPPLTWRFFVSGHAVSILWRASFPAFARDARASLLTCDVPTYRSYSVSSRFSPQASAFLYRPILRAAGSFFLNTRTYAAPCGLSWGVPYWSFLPVVSSSCAYSLLCLCLSRCPTVLGLKNTTRGLTSFVGFGACDSAGFSSPVNSPCVSFRSSAPRGPILVTFLSIAFFFFSPFSTG